MNKSMLVGVIAGIGVAAGGGVAAFSMLGERASSEQEVALVEREAAAMAVEPATARVEPEPEARPALAVQQPSAAPAPRPAQPAAPRPAAQPARQPAPQPAPVAAVEPPAPEVAENCVEGPKGSTRDRGYRDRRRRRRRTRQGSRGERSVDRGRRGGGRVHRSAFTAPQAGESRRGAGRGGGRERLRERRGALTPDRRASGGSRSFPRASRRDSGSRARCRAARAPRRPSARRAPRAAGTRRGATARTGARSRRRAPRCPRTSGCGDQLADDALAHAREQHEMPRRSSFSAMPSSLPSSSRKFVMTMTSARLVCRRSRSCAAAT